MEDYMISYTLHIPKTYHIITCCYLWHPTWCILGAHDWPWDSGYAWLSQGTIPVINSMYFQFYSCCSFIVLYPSLSPILLAQSCRVNWLPWVTSGFPRHRWASESEGSPLRSGVEFSIEAQMDWLKEKNMNHYRRPDTPTTLTVTLECSYVPSISTDVHGARMFPRAFVLQSHPHRKMSEQNWPYLEPVSNAETSAMIWQKSFNDFECTFAGSFGKAIGEWDHCFDRPSRESESVGKLW